MNISPLGKVPRTADPDESLREVQAIEAVYIALDAIAEDPQMVERVLKCAINKYRLKPSLGFKVPA